MGEPAVQLEPPWAKPEKEDFVASWAMPGSQPALIGNPPPLRPFAGRRRSPLDEFCPFLEPGSNWTTNPSL